MIAIIIFFVLLIGLNLIPELSKKEYPKTEKIIKCITLIVTLTFITTTILSLSGLKLKGLYSNQIIGIICLISSLSYFVIIKNTKSKIIPVLILIPLIFISLYFQFFSQNLGYYKVNDKLNFVVSREGFLGCGEIIRLTETKFIIFDKEIIYERKCTSL